MAENTVRLASEEASETLSVVTIEDRGYLFMSVRRTYVILYFDPHVFVFARTLTSSHMALNRIL